MTAPRKPVVSAVPATPTVKVARRPLTIGSEPVILRNAKRAVVVHGAPPVVTKPITRRMTTKPPSRQAR